MGRKIPLKSMSFGIGSPANMIRQSSGGGQVLPSHLSDVDKPNKPDPKSPLSRHRSYQASEKGRGDILPTLSRSKSAIGHSPIREGYATDSGAWSSSNRGTGQGNRLDTITQKLRSRRRCSSTEDLKKESLMNTSSHHSSGFPKKDFSCGDPFGSDSSKYGTSCFTVKHLLSMRKREWLQLFVIIAISLLVFDSYTKAVETSDRLNLFQQQENRMMLHLQRIEQHSKHLHESMISLSDVADMVTNPGSKPLPRGSSVDSNLIRVQAQQLTDMEQELDHELRALQAKMQNVARSSIVRTYGEGPVQITLDLNFPGGPREPGDHSMITILLWYDTPHAAWTLLQQIRRGEWNGASFGGNPKGGMIEAAPMIGNAGTIDFVEKSQKGHEAWTVGLTDLGNSLGMFINLQDNTETHKRDVCVGKVIDGFEALQRLVSHTGKAKQKRQVTIKKATAMHLSSPGGHDRL